MVIPTVLPDILGGMRVALGAAWLTIVAAELAGGISLGLGRMMTTTRNLFRSPGYRWDGADRSHLGFS